MDEALSRPDRLLGPAERHFFLHAMATATYNGWIYLLSWAGSMVIFWGAIFLIAFAMQQIMNLAKKLLHK